MNEAMQISMRDARALLEKWKDESTPIAVVAEGPYRQWPFEQSESLRTIHGAGVRWTMRQVVKVRQITEKEIVFEGSNGDLALSLGNCRILYQEPREARPEIREEAESETLSRLSIFFPNDEAFLFYEIRES